MIRQTLDNLRSQGRSALIPYLTAGMPDLATTPKLLFSLAEAGADLIELGVPFSDPVADGPVIQRASEQSLAQGTTLAKILELVAEVRAQGLTTPIILFSYYNPIYRFGLEAFARTAKAAGISGVLVVDLLPETATAYSQAMQAAELETVFLTAPTTKPSRLAAIDAASTGCVYYVSRTGVTGTRSEMADNLNTEIGKLKSQLSNPLIVGFGISTPAHVTNLKGIADGIVVGSALMAAIEAAPSPEAAITAAYDLISSLKAPLMDPAISPHP
jgi:tryptophan synthase alpha chain